jgi:hypothetical protein
LHTTVPPFPQQTLPAWHCTPESSFWAQSAQLVGPHSPSHQIAPQQIAAALGDWVVQDVGSASEAASAEASLAPASEGKGASDEASSGTKRMSGTDSQPA